MKFRSILLAEARGSMAGATFSRNGNSAYVRARATPVNPRSSAQTVARDSLNTIATLWRSLLASERKSWVDLAKVVPYVNSLGESSFYSGFQFFMKNNLILNALGAPLARMAPATAPTFPSVGMSGLFAEQDTVTFGDFTLNATSANGSLPAEMVLQMDTTFGFSAGKSFVAPSQYRPAGIVTLSPTNPINLSGNFTSVFGTPSVSLIGTKIACRFRIVDASSGFVTPWLELAVIVAEA
jgi:hypothetical protein